MGRWLIYNLSY